MRQIFTFKRVVFFGILLVAILYTVDKLLNQQSTQITTNLSPTPTKELTYKTLIPGKSNAGEVKEKLGDPLKTTQKEDIEVLEYKGTNSNWNGEVYIKNQQVDLIKQIASVKDQINVKDITTSYGEPKNILYGPYTDIGFFLYVYPENGSAYLGNKEKGVILEVWYFSPTTIDDFRKKYAQEYSESKKNAPRMIDKAPGN